MIVFFNRNLYTESKWVHQEGGEYTKMLEVVAVLKITNVRHTFFLKLNNEI